MGPSDEDAIRVLSEKEWKKKGGGRDAALSDEIALTRIREWTWSLESGDIWLFNNLPYADVLDCGHSKQAPNGVYLQALPEIERNIQVYADASGGAFTSGY